MNALFSLFSLFVAHAAHAAHAHQETPVRATLGDGQILMGEVQTRTLRLMSGSGMLEIPLADVGEVVPADQGGLGASEGRVDVWLRNGSELRGTWADPKLAMSVAVGGDDVAVDLPMNDLSRFQLQGGTRWPGGPIYRLRTRDGDDFLIDPARTHLVLESVLGTFEPLLSECASVAPIDDPRGTWRVQLKTGTVLLGNLQNGQLTVALPMGPEEISVALDDFVSLRVESWNPRPAPPRYSSSLDVQEREPLSRDYAPEPARAEALEAQSVETVAGTTHRKGRAAGAPTSAPAATEVEDDWFDSSALQSAKDAQQP